MPPIFLGMMGRLTDFDFGPIVFHLFGHPVFIYSVIRFRSNEPLPYYILRFYNQMKCRSIKFVRPGITLVMVIYLGVCYDSNQGKEKCELAKNFKDILCLFIIS